MLIGIREIEEKYEVLAKMGEGGMGSIYKARHRLLEEIRVIKTIKPQFQADKDLQNRFLREARVAAKLRHPNIATIHDFAISSGGDEGDEEGAEGTAYIVMDFIDGTNLREYQRGGGELDMKQVTEIGLQALDALAYLHEKNFVHRDISTDNMMIGRQNQRMHVTLIDLGLAKSLEGSQWKTKTGMVVGKVRYISPEQLNSGFDGVEVDARSDLYSFGVVLYELLTGEFPIVGADDMSLIAGHLYRPPRPFDETDPKSSIPSPLRSVIMKALEKKPEDRWQSARDFIKALQDAMDPSSTQGIGVEASEERTVQISGGHLPPPAPGVNPEQATATVNVSVARARSDQPESVLPMVDGSASAHSGRHTVPVDANAVTAPIQVDLAKPRRDEASRRRLMMAIAAVAVVALLVAAWALDLPQRLSGGTAGSASPVLFGRYHALVIGIDEYQKLPPLETAVADARAVADVLKRRYGFEVTLLENPTRFELHSNMSDIATKMTSRDNLLVYYAGHGTEKNLTQYWQPADAEIDNTTNWISTQSIVTSELSRSKARHVLVIADSCYAGAMVASEDGLAEPELEPGADPRAQLASLPSRVVMSSGGFEPVLDIGTDQHSVFANALLEALRKNDSELRTEELFLRIKDDVAARAQKMDFEQTPVLAPMATPQDRGGQLFFVPAKS